MTVVPYSLATLAASTISCRLAGGRNRQYHVPLAKRRGNHSHQLSVGIIRHRDAEPEEAIHGFTRRHRRASADAESHELVAGSDRFGGAFEIGNHQLTFGCIDGAMDVLENDLPQRRLALIVADIRRLFQIDPPDHEALSQFHLEFAHAGAADGAAEARDGRFADACAARQLAIGAMKREIDIGQDSFGDAPFRWTKRRGGLLDDRNDVLGNFRNRQREARARAVRLRTARFLRSARHCCLPSPQG